MRFAFVFTFLWLVGSGIQGQDISLVGAQFDYSYTDNTYYPASGVSVELMFKDHFSITYSLLYSPTGSDEYYLYTGGGQAAAIYLIREAIKHKNGLDLAIPLGIVSFILPESYTFRIPIAKKSQLGFFVAPYGFEFVKNRDTDEEDHDISFEMGCRYYWVANPWIYITPQVGVKKIYNEDGLGASFGISVMFKVKEKEEE